MAFTQNYIWVGVYAGPLILEKKNLYRRQDNNGKNI